MTDEYYHVEGSRVVHPNEGCHHLDDADDYEELDAEEAESYRTCTQCAYDNLSASEKAKRKRKQRRSHRSSSVRIRK